MQFDNIFQPACNIDVTQNQTTCKPDEGSTDDDVVTPPSDDERCADPAFADANPTICAGYPRLILKPAYALLEPGQNVTFQTFIRTGGNEQELTLGLAYAIANPNVATISPSGVATGFSPGITTVSVQWQNLSAHAQVEVITSCAEVSSNFLLLIDNSKSSSVQFSATYPTRLAYAKEAARRFVDALNFGKDKIGIGYFNESGQITYAIGESATEAKAAIDAITATESLTNIADGLQDGMTALDAEDGRAVLVVFSDFEKTSGSDPLPVANAWKQAGNVIVVMGLRVYAVSFDLAFRVASAGFFLSCYDDVADANIDTLLGLKSFLCSADCPPSTGTYPKAAINYRGFVNWDVIAGQVDLHGLGTGAPGDSASWDVLPGHGLYVDLLGRTLPDHFGATSPLEIPGGVMLSKEAFEFTSGKTYRFALKVAGNNRTASSGTYPVRVRIIKEDETTLLDEEITPTSWDMDFTEYDFEFTPGADATARIRIEMSSWPASFNGTFIDDVLLENLTDDEEMLYDDFNAENPTTIEVTYAYYGCLTAPPEAQIADPEPPSGSVETVYRPGY